jgi:hypothetical protein
VLVLAAAGAGVCCCSVVIKVDASETAVLCTHSKTFALQQVETSNTWMLMPLAMGPVGGDASTRMEVSSIVSSHLEVRSCVCVRAWVLLACLRPCVRACFADMIVQ